MKVKPRSNDYSKSFETVFEFKIKKVKLPKPEIISEKGSVVKEGDTVEIINQDPRGRSYSVVDGIPGKHSSTEQIIKIIRTSNANN